MPHFNGQALQDKFVLSILKNKKNGVFMDMGAHEPIHINNTYILEYEFGWKGVLFDYFEHFREGYKKYRPNSVHIISDATTLDYKRVMDDTEMPPNIDYLSLDLDGDATIKALRKLDSEVMDRHKFAVVTFEHDVYEGGNHIAVREESREIFKRRGYVCVFEDIHHEKPDVVYEDWYVHPELVDMEYVTTLKERNVHKYGKNTITGKSLDWRSISYESDIKITYSIQGDADPSMLIGFLEKMKDPDDDIQINMKPGEALGDYIFHINTDEMPTEDMIKKIKGVLMEKGCDAFFVPRINIYPGITEEYLHLNKDLKMNEVGWINWPDFQRRIYKNDGKVHENGMTFTADPKIALTRYRKPE